MPGRLKSRGDGVISSPDAWRAIRWNRRLCFSLPLLLGLGLIVGAWLFPALELQEHLEWVGISIFVIGWLLALWPAPWPPMWQAFSHLEHSELAVLVPHLPQDHLCAVQVS